MSFRQTKVTHTKSYKENYFSIFSFLFTISFHSFGWTAAQSCQNLFNQTQLISQTKNLSTKELINTIQIGFESEYVFSEASQLLKWYYPKSMGLVQWQSLSEEDQIAYLKSTFTTKPEYAIDSNFVLVNEQSSPKYLPKELILDSTGNLEIVLPPFNNQVEWESAVDEIAQLFGVGSQQAMVSIPREYFFSEPGAINSQLGFLNLIIETDTLSKLAKGYEEFVINPNTLIAKSFNHPFLGPITLAKQETMKNYLYENSFGRFYDDSHKRWVKKMDASFKFIGGVAYRPDIGAPDKVSFEIRHAHKSVNKLKNMVQRQIHLLTLDLTQFSPYAQLKAFDSRQAFDSLSDKIKTLLIQLFPSQEDPRFSYFQESRLALQVYRNFAYPCRDWSPIIEISQVKGLQIRVLTAKEEYLLELNQIADQLSTGQITQNQAQILVQGALGKFAKTSGLSETLQSLLNEIEKTGKNKVIALDKAS